MVQFLALYRAASLSRDIIIPRVCDFDIEISGKLGEFIHCRPTVYLCDLLCHSSVIF